MSATTRRASCFASRNRWTSSSRLNRSGPASSTVPFTGGPTAKSASAAATSSDTTGCTNAGDKRTVRSSVADWAMPATKSKNYVERRIVYGMPEALIRFSWATFARM